MHRRRGQGIQARLEPRHGGRELAIAERLLGALDVDSDGAARIEGGEVHLVDAIGPLVAQAADLAEAESLRGYDAVHLAAAAAPDVAVSGLTVVGDPREVLVDLSEGAHLLVLGSRGRGAIRSLLLGSVSAAVSQHAACPVIVCRPRELDHRGRGVLVAADGTPESIPVIEFAFAQAAARHKVLTVVHCVWDVVAAVAGQRNVSLEGADIGAGDEMHRKLSGSIAEIAEKYPDVPVSLCVTHGLVDDIIGGHTAAWDLVVVGRHPLDTVGRLITGSIATAVVERARTIVGVVPELRPARDQ